MGNPELLMPICRGTLAGTLAETGVFQQSPSTTAALKAGDCFDGLARELLCADSDCGALAVAWFDANVTKPGVILWNAVVKAKLFPTNGALQEQSILPDVRHDPLFPQLLVADRS